MAALYKCESWEEEKETAIVYKTVVCHHCAHLLKRSRCLKAWYCTLKTLNSLSMKVNSFHYQPTQDLLSSLLNSFQLHVNLNGLHQRLKAAEKATLSGTQIKRFCQTTLSKVQNFFLCLSCSVHQSKLNTLRKTVTFLSLKVAKKAFKWTLSYFCAWKSNLESLNSSPW